MGQDYDEATSAYDDLKGGGRSSGGRAGGPQGGGPHPHGGGGGGGRDDKPPEAWEPDHGDRIRPGGQTGSPGGGTFTGSSSSSGSSSFSSGGSSGGGVAPGFTGNPRDDKLITQAESLYYQLWGEYPATGYAKALVKKGLNIFEIEDHERRKPAFKKSDVYQDEYAAFAKMISSVMGTR